MSENLPLQGAGFLPTTVFIAVSIYQQMPVFPPSYCSLGRKPFSNIMGLENNNPQNSVCLFVFWTSSPRSFHEGHSKSKQGVVLSKLNKEEVCLTVTQNQLKLWL